MHGRVAVQSSPGEGCAFLVTVPLSLSSTRGLLVRLGQERYAVPLEAILRIVAVARPDMQLLEGQPVLLINRQPVRVVQLGRLLGVAWSTEDDPAPTSQLALLLGSGERQAAFLVDAVLGEQELIIHRLPAPLGPVRCIAGATILADGEVLPILDVVDVIDSAMKAQYASGPSSEPEQAGRSPTVLVVDDSITTRTLEKNILEAAGYQVRLATDGVEALTVLQALADSGGCQLLLSDVDMPRLNGFELTRQVRATAAFQHLPIVLVTSLDTPGDRAQGIAAGADAYIVKRTFDQGVLLDTIAQLL
jgi:two-component system, chemotaxis family, sensor kinase CheA